MGLVVAALAVTIGLVPAAGADTTAVRAEGSVAPGGDRQSAPRTLTLITGDRVTSYGGKRLHTAPRKGVTFLGFRVGDHQYVVPSDAVAALRADRLDLRLFDVTGQLEGGYDRRSDLPLIVSGRASAAGLAVRRSLAAVRGFSTSTDRDRLASTWRTIRPGLTSGKVWLDGMRRPSLEVSVPQIGAPAVWAAGHDGSGVTVAVLDTGIDATHPDLVGAVSAARNFAAEEEDGADQVGHGTHVASTIAGTGAGSNGRYRGVAPGAKLLDGKVCVRYGCQESWILGGMQWAAESGADVINMSIGGFDTPEIDPVEAAVNDLTDRYGALFVVAAGNAGDEGTVESPASADAALAVGAVTKTGERAEFSSAGPRSGDWAVKPEITAPGVDIVAARSRDLVAGGDRDSADGEPGDLYMSISGTSMATPHVAGAAALLTQIHPRWSPALRKAALMAAADPNPAIGVFAQGAGRVDVARAATQAITTTPASVSFAQTEYPHEDDPVLTRRITYHNPTAEPVTLGLAVSATAPAGMFALDASSVTVAAGGDAAVTLTADTRRGGDAAGTFGGQVTATATGVRVQTPFGVVREEKVDVVRLTVTDRAGRPAVGPVTVLSSTEPGAGGDYVSFEPEVTLRVVPGSYLATTYVAEADGSVDLLVYPALVVAGGRDLAMDARLARGYDVTVPHRDATPTGASVTISYTVEGTPYDTFHDAWIDGPSFGSMYTAHLGPRNVPGLSTTAAGQFARADAAGDVTDSPYSYQVGWHSLGEVFTGLTRHLRKADLATIDAEYGANGVDTLADRHSSPIAPGMNGIPVLGLPVRLPGRRTEYVAGNVAWTTTLWEYAVAPDGGPDDIGYLVGDLATYQAGHRYQARWNQAVFGSDVTGVFPFYWTISREGDEIRAAPSMYADSSGHQGEANHGRGRVALYRDSDLVAETDGVRADFIVAPEPARYRLEVREDRVAPVRLSTTVESVWTFQSSTVAAATPLPVMGIGFKPRLDERNTARPGTVGVVPITVSHPHGTDPPAVTAVTVEVSDDDGATWRPATVARVGESWVLTTRYPDRAGFVSLRAQATDSAGNTVRQTVIRAYELS